MTTDVPGLNPRREAREEALALLYQAELTSSPVDEALGAREVPPAAYAVEIASGVDDERDDLDALSAVTSPIGGSTGCR